MRPFINIAASAAALLGLATTLSANDYYTAAQREQIHQQYLSPVEHQALHQGLNSTYGSGYGGYQYSPSGNVPYNAGYGVSYGTAMPTYRSNFGVQPFGLGRSRSRCSGSQYPQPYTAGYRAW